MNLFYCDEVKVFIKKLEKKTQAKIVRGINLLEQYGTDVGMPHVKRITHDLYELRIRGQQEVRLFFGIKHNAIFFLHGFIKKAQKTPEYEIETARKRFGS
jgi:phage-related protein